MWVEAKKNQMKSKEVLLKTWSSSTSVTMIVVCHDGQEIASAEHNIVALDTITDNLT